MTRWLKKLRRALLVHFSLNNLDSCPRRTRMQIVRTLRRTVCVCRCLCRRGNTLPGHAWLDSVIVDKLGVFLVTKGRDVTMSRWTDSLATVHASDISVAVRRRVAKLSQEMIRMSQIHASSQRCVETLSSSTATVLILSSPMTTKCLWKSAHPRLAWRVIKVHRYSSLAFPVTVFFASPCPLMRHLRR